MTSSASLAATPDPDEHATDSSLAENQLPSSNVQASLRFAGVDSHWLGNATRDVERFKQDTPGYHDALEALRALESNQKILRVDDQAAYSVDPAAGEVIRVSLEHGTIRRLLSLSELPKGLEISSFHISPSGAVAALGLRAEGSNSEVFDLLNLRTGKRSKLIDSPEGRAELAWASDSSGIYFSSFQPPETESPLASWGKQSVKFQAIDGSATREVFISDSPSARVRCLPSPCGKNLFISEREGFSSEVHLHRLDVESGERERIDLPLGSGWFPLFFRDGKLHCLSDAGANNYCLAAIDTQTSEVSIVVPEFRFPLEDAVGTSDGFLVHYRDRGKSLLQHYNVATGERTDIPLAGATAIEHLNCEPALKGDLATLVISSSGHPPVAASIYLERRLRKVHVSAPSSLFRATEHDYAHEYSWAKSEDGTEIPFSVFSRKAARGKAQPTIVSLYGAFGDSIGDNSDPVKKLSADAGAHYVQVHARGGGERGRVWHDEGRGVLKVRAKEDLIATAEHLIERGIAAEGRVALRASSAGALVAAAAMLERPDLFCGAAFDSGLFDLSRYPYFLGGSAWISEFGDPATIPGRHAIDALNPLTKDAKGAPPTLCLHSLDDTIVPPLHSAALIRNLQEASADASVQEAPHLFASTTIPHGDRGYDFKNLEKYALEVAFLGKCLQLNTLRIEEEHQDG